MLGLLNRQRHGLREIFDSLTSEGRGWVLLTIATGWLLLLGTRLTFPALFPQIKVEFGIDNAAVGLIMSLIAVMTALMQFPSGILADRIGERKVLVAGTLIISIGLLSLSLLPYFAMFIVGILLFGLGFGLYGSPRVMVLSNIYDRMDGTAIGITFSAGHIGTTFLPVIGTLIMLRFGWRTAFVALVPLFLLITLGLWRFAPSTTLEVASAVDRPSLEVVRRLAHVVTGPAPVLSFASLALWGFTFGGISTFLPIYLIGKGLRPGQASLLFGLFFASGFVSQVLSGGGADRFGYRRVLTGLAAFGILPLLALPYAHGIVPLAALTVLLGTRLGMMPVTNAYLVAALPEDVQGTGYGLVRTLYALLGATGPIVIGTLADTGLFDEAFLLMGGITAVMAVFYARLPVLVK